MDDLDLDAVDRAFQPSGRVPDGGALESLGFVTEAGGGRVATNAGVILFGTAPARRGLFLGESFRCACSLWTEKVDFRPEYSTVQFGEVLAKAAGHTDLTYAGREQLVQSVPWRTCA